MYTTGIKILNALRQFPAASISELASRIGIRVSVTRSSLGRLLVAKKVVQRDDGSFALPGDSPLPAAPPPPPVILRTHWILLGDRSGSMRSLEEPTLKETNNTLDSIVLSGQQPNQEVVVSYWSFGTHAHPEFRALPASQVRHLNSYRANLGGTALFDAMGDAITEAEETERGRPETSFVLMVLTDGEENESKRWAKNTGAYANGMRDVSKILELIRRVQATDKWTVALQVPRGYKAKLCRDFEIPEGNVVEWDQSERGAREAGAMRSAGIQNYAAQRAAGKSSVRSMFITTDLSNIKASDVRSSLDNVTSRVKIYMVQKEEDIKSFVERETGRPFVRGTSFYQLTKTESRIQPDKILLVMEKGKKDVWGGDAARQLLGLPTDVHCRVKPGNHANFDMFIQSKSDNRKMVRGTKLIHAPMGL